MNRSFHVLATAALAAAGLSAGLARAQSTGAYPYRATAPSNYHGSNVRTPGSMITPNSISNAARSPSGYESGSGGPAGLGGGLYGGDIPAFLRMEDARAGQTGGNRNAADTKAHIWLRLPKNAAVWVDDKQTRQTGDARYFYSPPLQPGAKYTYHLRIRWTEDGKPVEKKQDVIVHAGAKIQLDLTRPPAEKAAK